MECTRDKLILHNVDDLTWFRNEHGVKKTKYVAA